MISKLTKHLFRGGQKLKKGFALPVFIALIFTALIFISCNNLFEEPVNQNNTESPAEAAKETEKKYISISGSLSIDGALPAEYARLCQIGGDSSTARTAFPSIPSTGLTYTVTAVNTASGSTESYAATVTTGESGTNYVVAIPAPVPTSETPDPTKTFKITASVKQGDDELFNGESEDFTISFSSPVAGEAVNVSVHAKQTVNYIPAGTGNASLEVGISGSGVTKGKLSIDNGAASVFEADSNKIVFTSFGLNSGVHTAKFDFINDDNLVLYSFTEVINIFDNMTTNTWVQNGNEPWFNTTTAANGTKTTTCQVTAAMVEGFTLTEIWVKKNATGSHSGTFFNPKSTFNDALAMLHDAGKDYTIYIIGEITGTCTIPNTLKKTGSGGSYTYARSLTLRGYTGLNEGVPQDSINGGYTENDNGHTLKILTEVPVIIKNLKITGGYCAQSVTGGGGIYSTGDLTLESGALITGNYSKSCGGGVYNDGGILRIKSGAVISDNHEVASVTNCGGGGVFNNNGTLIMSGGTIKANTAAHDGGGIYNTITNGDKLCVAYIYGDAVIGGDVAEDGNKALGTSGDGGGIYNKGGLIYFGCAGYLATGNQMEDVTYYDPDPAKNIPWTGKLSHNTTGGWGGGIINYPTTLAPNTYGHKVTGIIHVQSGKISSNSATMGGGIAHHNGTLFYIHGGTIGGDSASEGNSATNKGGGIYTMGKFYLKGGTVSYNTADLGGGVCGDNGLLMYGGTIKNNTATTHGGGVFVDYRSLQIRGSAYIPAGSDGKNDVYLNKRDTEADPAVLYLVDPITPPEECTGGIVALITPHEYTDNKEIITIAGSETATTTIANEFTKFDVKQPDTTSHYLINYLGKLQSKYGSKSAPSDVYDIVFNDGSAEAYSSSLVLSKKQKDNAIAVIYITGTSFNDAGQSGERLLGVGLVQKRLTWCTSTAKAYNEILSSILYSSDKNGSTNLSQIANALGTNNDTGIGSNSTTSAEDAAALYPAFYFGINYKDASRSHYDDMYYSNVAGTAFETGWYLPSYHELIPLIVDNAAHTAKINTILELIHGMPFTQNFVDGEQYGWWVSSITDVAEENKTKAAYLVYSGDSIVFAKTAKERGFITCAIRQFN